MTLTFTPKIITCSCCGADKPETEYYRATGTGIPSGQCKECTNIKRHVKRDRAKHGKFVSKEKQRNMEHVEYELAHWCEAMLHFRSACAFCGKKEGRAKADKMDRDHLIPLSKGGKTTKENIIPACRKCNRGRGARDWQVWFRDQPFYCRETELNIEKWINKEW